MKPTIIRNRQIFTAANHFRSKQLGATLSKELREKYGRRSARVVEGDSVRIMRGEFKGIDGKVTRVSPEKNGIAIEGIKREKLKGGNVDIYIHSSNVMITGLNLDDKWRQSRLEGQKTEVTKEKPAVIPKEKPTVIPKEKAKQKPLEIKKDDSKPEKKRKVTKAKSSSTDNKQTKRAKRAKKETK
ncbi:MAG: 50S ribosomal protein L24 [Thaumarchaeota archaeon]|nr:50S ribosomal protein L24 [Nitrososphaerota archaeon]